MRCPRVPHPGIQIDSGTVPNAGGNQNPNQIQHPLHSCCCSSVSKCHVLYRKKETPDHSEHADACSGVGASRAQKCIVAPAHTFSF